MSDVTRILNAIDYGDPQAAEKLLPLIYDELRRLAAQKMAGESPGQTLQATALVHEAYVRLVDVDQGQDWNSRGHFYAAAAAARLDVLVRNDGVLSQFLQPSSNRLTSPSELLLRLSDVSLAQSNCDLRNKNPAIMSGQLTRRQTQQLDMILVDNAHSATLHGAANQSTTNQ